MKKGTAAVKLVQTLPGGLSGPVLEPDLSTFGCHAEVSDSRAAKTTQLPFSSFHSALLRDSRRQHRAQGQAAPSLHHSA